MEGDFRIDRWLVQPQLNTIVSPDIKTVQLEPKVMEVLVFLAGHGDEVLPKERILQAVWPDTFVTEDALMHAVSEIRKAFGDDAKDPRFIQTIPKRGYRLIAPVSALREAASRYEIIEKLGEGGMGEVFLARDMELQRKVALKFILAGGAEEESARKRLLREARAAAAMDHPFVAKIFDTGQMDGRTFIAMEYVEGRTLKQKLAKGRLENKEALRLAAEIAEALETAHDKGIVHRDLKPSNIMLTPQGHVKVMDFGLAKRIHAPESSASLEETVSAVTREGTTTGTLPYMSPEQLRGEAVDHRSDIFSFGIVLYEILAGVHPFQKASPMETAASILGAEPDWGSLPPDLPSTVRSLLRRCLQKDAKRRQQDILDARIEIEEVSAAPVAAGQGMARISPRAVRMSISTILIALVVGCAIGALLIWKLKPAPSGRLVRSMIKLPPGLRLSGMSRAQPSIGEVQYGWQRPSRTAIALSPDGGHLVYCATDGDNTRLPSSCIK